MSTTIDNRVVSMEFDNKAFEQSAAETLKTLKNLDQSVNNVSNVSSKGFENLGRAVGNVSFEHMGNAIDKIADKFSFLGIVGVTALQKISNSIVDTGEKLIKSLTIEQVSAGWQKYNDKIESVQTIMNATGESIEYVESQLDKLMWFTDETSYSFTDMTSNIGKFTSAGIDLETATSAMMGISNWAALSGANVEKASHAMNNLSQALSLGAVKVQDWASIEIANMATNEFKQTAIDTAVELGRLIEVADGLYQVVGENENHVFDVNSFRSELATGWFDGEVLAETLLIYSSFTDALREHMDVLESVEGLQDIETTQLLELVDAYAETGETIAAFDKEFGENATSSMEDFSASTEDVCNKIISLSGEINYTTDAIMEMLRAAGNGEDLGDDYLTSLFGTESGLDFDKLRESIGELTVYIQNVAKAADVGEADVRDFIQTLLSGSGTLEGSIAETLGLDPQTDIEQINAIAYAVRDLGQEFYDFGRRAFEAGQETKTFKDAVNYVKDAVSTGWMDTFDMIFGNYEEAKVLWGELSNTLYEIFVKSGEARNALLQNANSSAWTQLSDRLAEAGVDAYKFQSVLKDLAKEQGIAIDEMIEADGSFEDSLRRGWLSSDMVTDGLKRIRENFSEFAFGIDSGATSLEEAMMLVDDIIYGKYGNGINPGDPRYEALTALGYDAEQVQKLVNIVMSGRALTTEDLIGIFEPVGDSASYTAEELDKLIAEAEATGKPLNEIISDMSRIDARDAFTMGLYNIMSTLITIVQTVREAWSDVFPPVTADHIRELAARFEYLTGNVRAFLEESDSFKNILRGIFSVVRVGVTVIRAAAQFIRPVIELVKVIGRELSLILSVLGDVLFGAVNVTDGLSPLISICRGLADVLVLVVRTGSKMIENVINPLIGGGLEKLRSMFGNAGAKLKDFALKISDTAYQAELADKIIAKFIDTFNKLYYLDVGDWLLKLGFSDETVTKITEKLQKIRAAIIAPFEMIKRNVTELIGDIKKIISGDLTVVDFVEKWWGKLIGKLKEIKEKVSETAKSIWTAITTGVSDSDIVNAIKTKAEALKNKIKGLFSSIFGGLMSGWNWLKTVPSLILGIAGALALLNGSRLIGWLTQIPKTLRQIKGYLKALKIQSWMKSFALLGVGLIGIMAAMYMLLGVLKLMNKFTPEELETNFNALMKMLIDFVGVIVIFIAALDQLKFDENVRNFGLGIAGLGVGLLTFAFAIEKFQAVLGGDNFPWKGILGVVGTLAAFIAAYWAIAAISKKYSYSDSGTFYSIAVMILAMCASLFLVIGAMKKLNKLFNQVTAGIDDKTGKKSGWAIIELFLGMIALMGIIAGYFLALSAIQNTFGKLNPLSVVSTLAPIFGAIIALQLLIATLKINQDNTGVLITAAGMLVGIAVMVGLLNRTLAKNPIDLKGIVGLVAAMALVIGAFASIALAAILFKSYEIGWNEFLVTLAAFVTAIAGVAAITWLLSKFGDKIGQGLTKAFTSLIPAIGSLLVIALEAAAIAAAIGAATWVLGWGFERFGQCMDDIAVGLASFKDIGFWDGAKAIALLLGSLVSIGIGALANIGTILILPKLTDTLVKFFGNTELMINSLQKLSGSEDTVRSGTKVTNLLLSEFGEDTGMAWKKLTGTYKGASQAVEVLITFCKNMAAVVTGLKVLAESDEDTITTAVGRINQILTGINFKGNLSNWADVGTATDELIYFLSKVTELTGAIEAFDPSIEGRDLQKKIDEIEEFINRFLSIRIRKNAGDYSGLPVAAESFIAFGKNVDEVNEVLSDLAAIDKTTMDTAIDNAQQLFGSGSKNDPSLADIAAESSNQAGFFEKAWTGIKLVFSKKARDEVVSGVENMSDTVGSIVNFGNMVTQGTEVIGDVQQLLSGTGGVGTEFMEMIGGGASGVLATLKDTLGSFSNILTNGINESGLGIGEVIGGAWFTSISSGIQEKFNDVGGFKGILHQFEGDLTATGSYIGQLMNELFGSILGGENGTLSAEQLVGENASEQSDAIVGTVARWLMVSKDKLKTMIADGTIDFSEVGTDIGDNLTELLGKVIGGETNLGEIAQKYGNEMAQKVMDALSLGFSSEENGAGFISEGSAAITNWMGSLFTEAQAMMGDAGLDFSSLGTDAAGWFQNGFMTQMMPDAGGFDIGSAVQQYLSPENVKNELATFADRGKEAGLTFAEGIKNSDVAAKLKENSLNLVKTAIQEISNAMDNIGPEKDALMAKIEETARNAAEIIQKALSFDCTPTITPVVSTENMNGAFTASGDGFGDGRALALGSEISRKLTEIQNHTEPKPVTTVTLESGVLRGLTDAINRTKEPAQFTMNFTGNLAQLAALLHPYITAENNRRGPSLIR